MNEQKALWVEKYRPKTVEDYVFMDDRQRQQVVKWIETRNPPMCLFSGPAGTGKTTLAKLIVHQLGIDKYDILEINASRENSVDDMRTRITGFAQTMPFGDLKIIILDEADHLSPNAQAALRGIMEEYHATVRFFLTANYPNRIIPAIHSRCQGFHIDKLDLTEFTARVATVLVNENVEFELETLDTYVKATYPDMRKCLNSCQMNTIDNRLVLPNENVEGSTSDYRIEAVELFKKGKIREARKLLCAQVRPEEMEDLIRWAFDNLDLWAKTEEGKDQAILIIRNAAVNASFVADHEINVSAMITELAGIAKEEND